MSRRIAILTMTFAVVAAACTTEATSTPGQTLAPVATPGTTTPPTTAAPTTIAVAPTTEAPTTTVAPTTTSPAGPADAVVPLLAGGASSPGWLSLGSWQRTRWQQATDASGNPVDPNIGSGTEFVLTDLTGERSATSGRSGESCFDGSVGPSIDVDVEPPEPPGFGYSTLAVADPAWQLKPRRVAVVDENVPATYQALGEAAVAAAAVDATLGAIEQLVVSDLDGDGNDEALAVFEFVQPGATPGTTGDVAALLLIDVESRSADTVLLSAIGPVVDEFSFQVLDRFRVLDVADLNGDGRMEVIVHSWYYEGAGVIVYDYAGGELREVLANGCGA